MNNSEHDPSYAQSTTASSNTKYQVLTAADLSAIFVELENLRKFKQAASEASTTLASLLVGLQSRDIPPGYREALGDISKYLLGKSCESKVDEGEAEYLRDLASEISHIEPDHASIFETCIVLEQVAGFAVDAVPNVQRTLEAVLATPRIPKDVKSRLEGIQGVLDECAADNPIPIINRVKLSLDIIVKYLWVLDFYSEIGLDEEKLAEDAGETANYFRQLIREKLHGLGENPG